MKNNDADATLVRQVVDGSEPALASLYDSYGSLLYSVALRIMGDRSEAEEVVQDTFFQLWQNASLFDSNRGSLTGWLLTLTRNRAISRLRKERAFTFDPYDEQVDVPGYNSGLANALEVQIARQLVTDALATLPAAQREAIMLAYFDGLTNLEISVRTRTPLGTTKTRLRTALNTMRECLLAPRQAVTRQANSQSIQLDDILITDQLPSRPCRQHAVEDESESLRRLAEVAAAAPDELINCFLQMSLNLCGAHTAGLSFLENDSSGKQQFRWTHLEGRLAQHIGGTTPRNFSPCGVTLDRDSPQLFSYPGRYFDYFNSTGVPIVEGLVLPFHVGKETEGTVWIVSHEEGCGFDSEDARIMTQLTEFAACTFHLVRSLKAPDFQS